MARRQGPQLLSLIYGKAFEADHVKHWLADAAGSLVSSFAGGITKDKGAVAAALMCKSLNLILRTTSDLAIHLGGNYRRADPLLSMTAFQAAAEGGHDH